MPYFYSMTGFSRVSASHSIGQMHLEIRSVNHRYLETVFKLPELFRSFEIKLKEQLIQTLHRGKIDVILNFNSTMNTTSLTLNTEFLKNLKQLESSLSDYFLPQPASFLEWLRFPGILETVDISEDTLEKNLLELFNQGLAKLLETRRREGEALKTFIVHKLKESFEQINLIESRLPEIMDMLHKRYEQRLLEISKKIETDRFNQELAFLLQKFDVSEEISRFKSHLEELDRTLEQEGPIGRRLDFIVQELHREANTLGAKSIDAFVSHEIIQLKLLVEQIREQVQNVE